MSNMINFVLGLPKTIYINLKCLPFSQAIKMPIFISCKCRLRDITGTIILNSNHVQMGMIKIGFGEVGIIDRQSHSCLSNSRGGVIYFNGKTNIGMGSYIDNHGIIEFGNGFVITARSSITCYKKIVFGDNVLISWDVLIMDTDTHKIYDANKNRINNDKEIHIGNNVWIGCRSLVLKGSCINDNCVIGASSVVSACYNRSNCLLVGVPAEEKRSNISWEI